MNKCLLSLALFSGAAQAVFFQEEASSQKFSWESFKEEHNKNYPTMDEETHRFNIFIRNLKVIDELNEAEQGSAVFGINKFADISASEFKASHLNYDPASRNDTQKTAVKVPPLEAGISTVKDWTGVYTTPVKDQGYCGSCWAFSATEQIESDWMRQGGKETLLSAQQVTSCTPYVRGGGCNGGFTENAFDYAKGGLELASDYPYTSGTAGVTGTCKASSSKAVIKTTGYYTVSSSSRGESDMASYVGSKGPLSVCVDANDWQFYSGGILSSCGTSVDHCVQAVGINTAKSYWNVRNSWGTSWGESGFIRLSYGANTCAIASDANYCKTASA
jgi:C1A family cysteine protease